MSTNIPGVNNTSKVITAEFVKITLASKTAVNYTLVGSVPPLYTNGSEESIRSSTSINRTNILKTGTNTLQYLTYGGFNPTGNVVTMNSVTGTFNPNTQTFTWGNAEPRFTFSTNSAITQPIYMWRTLSGSQYEALYWQYQTVGSPRTITTEFVRGNPDVTGAAYNRQTLDVRPFSSQRYPIATATASMNATNIFVGYTPNAYPTGQNAIWYEYGFPQRLQQLTVSTADSKPYTYLNAKTTYTFPTGLNTSLFIYGKQQFWYGASANASTYAQPNAYRLTSFSTTSNTASVTNTPIPMKNIALLPSIAQYAYYSPPVIAPRGATGVAEIVSNGGDLFYVPTNGTTWTNKNNNTTVGLSTVNVIPNQATYNYISFYGGDTGFLGYTDNAGNTFTQPVGQFTTSGIVDSFILGNNNEYAILQTGDNKLWATTFRETAIPSEVYTFSNSFKDEIIDGVTYTALGGLLGVSEIQRDVRVTGYDLNLSLTGLDPNNIFRVLNKDLRGATIEIYRGFYDENYVLNTTTQPPIKRYAGTITSFNIQETRENKDNDYAISIQASNYKIILENNVNGRKTNRTSWRDPYYEYPTDPSMDAVISLEGRYFDFGKPK